MSGTHLENKKLVIIGGTTGIGLSAAKAFINEGAKVVVVGDIKQAELLPKLFFLDKLPKKKIDLAFNVSEGIYGKDREAQIPAIYPPAVTHNQSRVRL